MTKVEISSELEIRLVDKIAESYPEGISRTDLIKGLPQGDRGRARGALDELVKRGSIVEVSVATGKKGKPAKSYRLPEWTAEIVGGK